MEFWTQGGPLREKEQSLSVFNIMLFGMLGCKKERKENDQNGKKKK